MKILFVCKANVFRSQIAEAYVKKFCKDCEVRSAGTVVSQEGQTLEDRKEKGAKMVVDVMKEEGTDISKKRIKLVTRESVKWADKIICMAQKETIPDFLKEKDFVFWDVEDATPESDYEFFVKSREKIKKLVRKFAESVREA
ncbi:low molecular weight phosphatase family protein [Candidatus Pacearchaeota archaeon]|nr:low molecular weight phosphatase family protein [Candidatus Pacearchaeota archaeon]